MAAVKIWGFQMNEYYSRMKFFYDSKPKSVRYTGMGFGLMIMTTVLVYLSNIVIVMIFAATLGLCGLVLFVMGLIYGMMDLYKSLIRKDATK